MDDMEILVRQHYLDKIEKYLGKDTIIVLTGQRRVGKSYTLRMIRDLKSKDENNNVIYVDKEKKAFGHIKTYQDLNAYIDAHYQAGKMNYILIDEVQEIEEFERTVRSYRTEPDAEVIVTGSNAKMLSKELSTIIGGRYKERKCRRLSTGIGRKAWKPAGRKRKEAPEEPPTGENGKKGKERTEG